MSDFRKELSKLVEREKLNVNTYRRLSEITGVSPTTLIYMAKNRHDVTLGNILAVLDATGYELEIKRKKEII